MTPIHDQPESRGGRMIPARLRGARAGDLAAVHGLLRAESLPTDGVDEALILGTSVVELGEGIAGSASVEVHGRTGLLRSVVVAPDLRRGGWGGRLVRDRIEWARAQGLESLVLFTETAADFFAGLGFVPRPREELPAEIRGCFEYGFCPSTSTSMALELSGRRAAG